MSEPTAETRPPFESPPLKGATAVCAAGNWCEPPNSDTETWPLLESLNRLGAADSSPVLVGGGSGFRWRPRPRALPTAAAAAAAAKRSDLGGSPPFVVDACAITAKRGDDGDKGSRGASAGSKGAGNRQAPPCPLIETVNLCAADLSPGLVPNTLNPAVSCSVGARAFASSWRRARRSLSQKRPRGGGTGGGLPRDDTTDADPPVAAM